MLCILCKVNKAHVTKAALRKRRIMLSWYDLVWFRGSLSLQYMEVICAYDNA
jgi:hypothetical protein